MIRQEEIAVVIDAQRESFFKQDSGFSRDALSEIPIADSFATIITGIRRCGKSTLLLQLLRRDYQDAIYLNFDDIRLSNFETGDFNIMIGVVNMKLRDEFSSLDDFLKTYNIKKERLMKRMEEHGYHYQVENNQFVRS